MPDQHAVLSPSDSERWTSCPAAIRLEEEMGVEEAETPWAREGTLAHERAEIEAKGSFGIISQKEKTRRLRIWSLSLAGADFDQAAMETHAVQYVKLLSEARRSHRDTQVLIEQRVDTGVPGCWGTADAILVSPEHIQVVDFKYGQGVTVHAEGNPQLRLYAVGALDTFGDLLGEPETVTWTIHQPRIGHQSSSSCSAADLRAWRDSLIPVAEEALQGSDRFGPSESACRWCPLAGNCRARVQHQTAVDFSRPPDVLTPEEVAALLPRLKDIRAWCDAVDHYALDATYSRGERIPGYKVVLSGGRRFISDPVLAIQTLIDNGFPAEQVSSIRARGLGELEKLVGGRTPLTELLGGLIESSPGKPSLVPEEDRRPAINPSSEAAKDFMKEGTS